MGIFSKWFGHTEAQQTTGTNVANELSEMKNDETIINDVNALEKALDPVFGTGMPIDAIYAYIERDYEGQGYSDSMCNADNAYKESKKVIIKDGLKRLFSQVRLRYQDDFRRVTVQIDIVEKQGMIDTSYLLKAKKETYAEHMKTIDVMEESLMKNDPKMLSMIDSYERGFLKGIAAISQTFLNTK